MLVSSAQICKKGLHCELTRSGSRFRRRFAHYSHQCELCTAGLVCLVFTDLCFNQLPCLFYSFYHKISWNKRKVQYTWFQHSRVVIARKLHLYCDCEKDCENNDICWCQNVLLDKDVTPDTTVLLPVGFRKPECLKGEPKNVKICKNSAFFKFFIYLFVSSLVVDITGLVTEHKSA